MPYEEKKTKDPLIIPLIEVHKKSNSEGIVQEELFHLWIEEKRKRYIWPADYRYYMCLCILLTIVYTDEHPDHLPQNAKLLNDNDSG